MPEKYLVYISQDDPTDIEVDMDDPTYDGPEIDINEDEGVYHITADNEDDAVKMAQFLDSIGNPN